MSAVVGIDLGTTNTVVACVREGRVHVLADEKGNRLLPSVVSFRSNGDVLVGGAAKLRRLNDAKNTIASIKRLIGRPWDSDEIRLARSRFAFELREGPGQGALVVARGEAYTLPEISAFVLKRVRQIAEAALGETVDRAVITVPAHFNELQRASTKVAGRVAGLEVLRILNEPTAAALAYGFGSSANERVAVYDYGGGTFDCSLLELSGNLYEVLATAGDTFLGGDDIDSAIAEQMCSAFLLQHRYDPRADPQAFEKLRGAAETLKIELSANMQAQVELKDVAYGVGGRQLGLTFAMTQADLDALAEPFVERTLQVTQDALNTARLSPSAFDRVVLVGGSTRMPLVRRRVESFFGMPVMDRVNPDEVVAIGAAIQANALAEGGTRSLPPPPMPGVLRAAQAEQMRPLRSTPGGNLGPEAIEAMVNADRKLPSIAPPAPSSGSPVAPTPVRRTLRPGQGAPETRPSSPPSSRPRPADAPPPPDTHPLPLDYLGTTQAQPQAPVHTDGGGHAADDDSMSYAATLPGNQQGAAPASREARLSSHTMQSSVSDRSLSTRGGNTLGERVERSIAEPPSITGSPAGMRNPPVGRGTLPPPVAPPRSRPPAPLPAPIPPPPRSSPHPGRADAFGSPAPFGDPFGGEARPLPTEEISLIVPDAQGHQHDGREEVHTEVDMNEVGPLPTEDISLISPDTDMPMLRASRPAAPARVSSNTGTKMNRPQPQPGPLPTEDISLISPEPMSMANRSSVSRSAAAMPAGPPPPLPFAPSGKTSQPTQPAPYVPPPAVAKSSQQNPLAYPIGKVSAQNPLAYPLGQPNAPAPLPLSAKSSQRAPSVAAPPGYGGESGRTTGSGSVERPTAYVPPETYGLPHGQPAQPHQPPGPPVPLPAGDPRAQPGWRPQLAPVLVDVTPRALVVEVVGGFSDTVIARNATIPCEHTRVFATGRDLQTTVHVRVAQGESQKFDENTYLGELELSGLRPASRGDVTLSVTFELDADGTLQVRATDTSSGKEARASMRLIAVAQDEEQIEEMIERSRSVSVTGG